MLSFQPIPLSIQASTYSTIFKQYLIIESINSIVTKAGTTIKWLTFTNWVADLWAVSKTPFGKSNIFMFDIVLNPKLIAPNKLFLPVG